MSELSFLIDLLLNEKLTKSVKDKIAERIKFVEENVNVTPIRAAQALPPPKVINGAVQSPSTVAAMERQLANPTAPPDQPPVVVASPAAANAIASRNQALNASFSGKPEPGRTSPRKF